MSSTPSLAQLMPALSWKTVGRRINSVHLLILLLVSSILLQSYKVTSSNEGKESFYYDCDFFNLHFFDSYCAIDGQNELLYSLAPNKPGRHEEKDPELGVPANVLTRWNLRTGQCELKRAFTPWMATIIGISPSGQWLLLSTVDVLDLRNITRETAEHAYTLFNTRTLEKVYTWRDKSLQPMEIVPPANLHFLGDEELVLFFKKEDMKTKEVSYYVSEWQLVPEIRESRRLPIHIPEGHRLISLGRLDRNRILCLTYLPPDKPGKQFAIYLVAYDISKRAITYCEKKLETAVHPDKSSGSGGAYFEVHELTGWVAIFVGVTIDSSGTFYLYNEKFQQVCSAQPPTDKSGESLVFASWSRDGKKLAFAGRRVAVYEVEKGEFRTLDTSLEELYDKWSRPPLFTNLAKVAYHPLGGMILKLAKERLLWFGLTFYPDNRRLAGMTTYGKVVIWDVNDSKVLNSFRIARNRHNAEMDRVLGLE